MGMSTHKIKGEDYYQCRDVKAERDKLLEEVAELLARIEAAEKERDALGAGNVGSQPTPSLPEGWKPIPEKHPTFDLVDLRLADGSVLCECVPQSDGDYWWNGPSGEVFIDPKYAPATHWRLAAAPEAKP